jgi:probable addiction module antidote protein
MDDSPPRRTVATSCWLVAISGLRRRTSKATLRLARHLSENIMRKTTTTRYEVGRDAGLSRESLYRGLSDDRSPDFDTIVKVVEALGLKLHAETD